MFLQDKLFVLFERLNLHNILHLLHHMMFDQYLVDRFLTHKEFDPKIHRYLCNILHLLHHMMFDQYLVDMILLDILFVLFDQL